MGHNHIVRFRRLALPLALLFLMQTVLLAVPFVPRATAQGSVVEPPAGEPTLTPLASVLNPDGTLRDGVELNGSVDTTGYQMQIDPDGAPRFVREEGAAAQPQQASIGQWIGGAGSGELESVPNAISAVAIVGEDFYVGGEFSTIGDISAASIARWNRVTKQWSALGNGVTRNGSLGSVEVITLIGRELWVGGYFDAPGLNLARWNLDTSSWLRMSVGDPRPFVFSGQVYDIQAGTGPDVYVAGEFYIPGQDVARYDRSTGQWDSMELQGSISYSSAIKSILVAGDNVFVGGGGFEFRGNERVESSGSCNGSGSCNIGVWNRSTRQWAGLGTGVNSGINDLAIMGNELIVGGDFTRTGTTPTRGIARWNIGDQSWSAIGGGLGNGSVRSIAVEGSSIYISGSFSSVGGIAALNVARWNTGTLLWTAVGSGIAGIINELLVDGTEVTAAGGFNKQPGIRTSNIVRWNTVAGQWQELMGYDRYRDTALGSLLASTTGTFFFEESPIPFVAGQANNLVGSERDRGADIVYFAPKYDYGVVDGWFATAGGGELNGAVYAMTSSRNSLFVGGEFTSLEPGARDTKELVYRHLVEIPLKVSTAIFPESIQPLGAGINGPVDALAIDGTLLYAGGRFTQAGGAPASNIARWHTALKTWAPLGAGVSGDVYAIAVSGSDVYVGGKFTQAGGVAASNIARWNTLTQAWSGLGAGVDGQVEALAVVNGQLYAGGRFANAGGVASRGIARWDGQSWSSIGSVDGDVRTIAVDGDKLYIGGKFAVAGGVAAANIAVWNRASSAWTPLGSGTDGAVETIAVAGSNVIVGGQFERAGGVVGTARLARFSYNPIPEITTLSPNRGPNNQATQVTVTGRNFTASPTVVFNGAQLPVSSPSDTQLLVSVPSGTQPPCEYSIGVVNSFGERGSARFTVEPSGPPVVTSLEPSEVNSGSQLTIRGTNLVCSSQVFIGGRLAGYTSSSDRSTVIAPSDLPVGRYDLTVTTPAGVSSTLPQAVNITRSTFVPPPGPYDVVLDSWEVTQGIQSLSNDVPLVANRATVVRVYAQLTGGPNNLPTQPLVRLYGSRNGQSLAGSPLRPVREDEVWRSVNKRRDPSYDVRGDPLGGWMFRLPQAWTDGGPLTLRAELVTTGNLEINRANNELRGTFTFTPKAPLCLKFVAVRTNAPRPVLHQYGPNGGNIWTAVRWVERILPVSEVWTYAADNDIAEAGAGYPFTGFNPYEMPDDSNQVNTSLWWLTQTENDPKECSRAGARTVYAGVVHQDTPREPVTNNTNGASRAGTHAMWFWLPPNTATITDFNSPSVSTLPHELGHQFGRKHVDCGGPENVDKDYPYNPCLLSDSVKAHYGLDVFTLKPISWATRSDLMSYSWSRWISDYTYTGIFNSISTVSATRQAASADLSAIPEVILISGVITPTLNSGTIEHVLRMSADSKSEQAIKWAQSAAEEYSSLGQGAASSLQEANSPPYYVRLFGPGGQLVDARVVTLNSSSEEEQAALTFGLTIPAPSVQVARIELWDRNQLLAAIQPGAALPTVAISQPTVGAVVNDTLNIAWSATDQDRSDRLSHTLQYSPDEGQTWRTLVANMPDSGTGVMSFNMSGLQYLPGSSQAIVRVLVSDGYNTTVARSAPFQVANRRPESTILWPAPETSIAIGEQIVLRGGGVDPEDGRLGDDSLRWSVNSKSIGVGDELFLDQLAPGTYTISLAAYDSSGQEHRSSVTINVSGTGGGDDKIYLPLISR